MMQHNKRFNFIKLFLAYLTWLLFLVPTQLDAGGFQISLKSQRQIAMGHTGVAMPTDASAIFFNPGGLAFVPDRNIIAGATMVDMRIEYMDEISLEKNHNEFNRTFPFSFYADWNIDSTNRWKLGLGIYTPYGNNLIWPDDWPGRYVLREIQLRTFYVQPTLSYQITEKLGAGIGFVAGYGDVLIRRALPLANEILGDGEVTLEGNAFGFGFNAGLYYRFNDFVSVGAAYLSNVNVAPDNGYATFHVPEALIDSFPSGTISTRLNLPYSLTAGINLSPSNRTDLNIDIQYTGWQSYDSLIVDFERNTTVLDDTKEPRLYENSFTIRFGGEYRHNEQFAFRAGTYFDLTPVKDGFVSPETPDANRLGVSAGLGYHLNQNFSIDFSLLYIEGLSRTELSTENYAGLGGTYKGRAFLIGLGLQFTY